MVDLNPGQLETNPSQSLEQELNLATACKPNALTTGPHCLNILLFLDTILKIRTVNKSSGCNDDFLICRIVVDNFDLPIKSRIQTKTKTNQSVHWTHQYAIKDRVTCGPSLNDCPQIPPNELPIQLLLPGKTTYNSFKRDCIALVSRIVTTYLSPFKQFEDMVVNHIPHMFTKEMKEQSERVCAANYRTFHKYAVSEVQI